MIVYKCNIFDGKHNSFEQNHIQTHTIGGTCTISLQYIIKDLKLMIGLLPGTHCCLRYCITMYSAYLLTELHVTV